MQRLMHDVGKVVGFVSPFVEQLRNTSNYEGTYMSERPLYEKIEALVQVLSQWKGQSLKFEVRFVELFVELYERNFIELKDVHLAQKWIKTLQQMRYQFPTILNKAVVISQRKRTTTTTSTTTISSPLPPLPPRPPRPTVPITTSCPTCPTCLATLSLPPPRGDGGQRWCISTALFFKSDTNKAKYWGTEEGILKMVASVKSTLSQFELRIYHDSSVSAADLAKIKAANSDVVFIKENKANSDRAGCLWRFKAARDCDVVMFHDIEMVFKDNFIVAAIKDFLGRPEKTGYIQVVHPRGACLGWEKNKYKTCHRHVQAGNYMMKPKGFDIDAALKRFELGTNYPSLEEWGSDEWFLSDEVHGKLGPSVVYLDRKQKIVDSIVRPAYGYNESFVLLPTCTFPPCDVKFDPVIFKDLAPKKQNKNVLPNPAMQNKQQKNLLLAALSAHIVSLFAGEQILNHTSCTYAIGYDRKDGFSTHANNVKSTFKWYSPIAAASLLKGHSILILGDSVGRRLSWQLENYILGIPFHDCCDDGKSHSRIDHTNLKEFGIILTNDWVTIGREKRSRLENLVNKGNDINWDVIWLISPNHDFEYASGSTPSLFMSDVEPITKLAVKLHKLPQMRAVVMEGVFLTHQKHHEDEEVKYAPKVQQIIQQNKLPFMDMMGWIKGKNCFQSDVGGIHMNNDVVRLMRVQYFLNLLALELSFGDN
jgi:hypothetical protein